MSDDWRVHAELESEIGAGHLLKGMHEREIASELHDHLDSRLPVTAEGKHVFVYTADRAQAETAAAAVAEVLEHHDLHGVVLIAQWHPVEEAWKDPDEPLPLTPEQQAAEHAALEEREARESAERGAQWEVRDRPRLARRGARRRRPARGRGPRAAAALEARLPLGRDRGRRERAGRAPARRVAGRREHRRRGHGRRRLARDAPLRGARRDRRRLSRQVVPAMTETMQAHADRRGQRQLEAVALLRREARGQAPDAGRGPWPASTRAPARGPAAPILPLRFTVSLALE